MAVPRVLSIAGTDPTGGAGIQADLKSIGAAGGFGMSVVTSLVAQNTHGVRSVHTPPLQFLTEQLESVFDDVTVDAVKIGMLGDARTVALISRWLEEHPVPVVVLDPVMIATSGDRLLAEDAEIAVRDLATRADVVTPNLRELGVLVGQPMATDLDEALRQAAGFAATHSTTVIVKGGHLTGPQADNAVVTPDGTIHHVASPRVDTPHTHGTGCSLSSALATRLAAGEPVDKALAWSTRWLHEAIRHAAELNVGTGTGPVDHFHRDRRLAAAASTRAWEHLARPALDGSGPGQLVAPSPTPSPRARIAPAGPYTAALWEATGGLWAEIMDLPFIRGLRDGTLPEEDFNFYLAQDAAYLNRYSRAQAHLSTIAPDAEAQVDWARGATDCIVAEKELHNSWLAHRDLPETGTSPVTLAYTDFLVASCHINPYVVGTATVLPCYWLYAEIGLELAAHNHAGHPYRAWLDMYSSQEFLDGTRRAIARVEQGLVGATVVERVQAAEAYLSACVHEREFFAQADRAW
ncbi:multifunctional thiamine-phosphate pyrophosphorylase/synthase/phosphomethylpyrimidine kinase [Corynebacterium halotolerans YIM 70093 = DSM 44683]|uniref:Thiamine biosynthesis multifunctional protein ThiED n=1 Tax=Corynebacterium halotolerans YIM 70093 = DSM 44683 TaxID=1121362 RepID=M1NM39_9CORY|nr:multifunctional thiamine-phosphate pyrophosphorylase/synthase/phosphomethylpyrimidine kinase [Corynebacterium halotolerans YIM 70093 = DSM 44683]